MIYVMRICVLTPSHIFVICFLLLDVTVSISFRQPTQGKRKPAYSGYG